MSDWILTLAFTPEAERTMAKFAAMPQRLPRAIMAGLDAALEVGLQQTLKTNFTGKGPFPVSEHRLGVRSGRLRTSFLRRPSRLEGDFITAGIGQDENGKKGPAKYWFAHEFGFDGQVSVAAHTSRRAFNEKGNQVRVRTADRSKKPHTFRTHSVAAHTRHLRIPERAPMRTGLTLQLPEMNRIMGGVIVRDLNGGPAQ